MSIEAPANFLDLVKRTRLECGVSGTGPTTVLNQVGEYQRLVAWVISAWTEIQTKHEDWDFLQLSASWVTIAGQPDYTPAQCGIPAGTFGRWIRNRFRNYLTATGLTTEMRMEEAIDYDTWRDQFYLSTLRDQRTRPFVPGIGPDDTIWLGPVPAAGYTITAQYYRNAVTLAADADIPALPPEHMLIIVYGAMKTYGYYESAPEVLARGTKEYDKIMGQMELKRLLRMGVGLGRALA